MARFEIVGLDAQGKQITKTIQADNRQEAGEKALEQEILIQTLKIVRGKQYKIIASERLNFIRLLAVTTKSGLPLLRGLQTILRESKKSDMNRMVMEIVSDLEEGLSISEALSNRYGIFDDLAIALVKAGEASGRLAQTLGQLYEYENEAYTFRKKIRSALSYPVVVFSFSLLVITLFVTVIVPRFKQTYESFGESLPAMTQYLLDFSELLTGNIEIVIALTSITIFSLTYFFKSPKYRKNFEAVWLKIPVFGEIFFWSILVKFSQTLGTLLQNQVNFIEALFLAQQASGSAWFKDMLKNTLRDVKEGDNLTDSLDKTGVFPELALQMIRMGEESGKLDELLINMAEFYQKNMEYRISTIESVLQPVVVIGLGVFIGFMVMALFLPMFDLPGVLK